MIMYRSFHDLVYRKYGAAIGAALCKTKKYSKEIGELFIELQPHNEQDEWYDDKVDCGKYRLRIGKHIIATWELYGMKNCCGICVSTAAFVDPKCRKNGLGRILNRVRIDLAKYMGYGLLLCTDVTRNKPQQRILESNGWKQLYTFINPRTKNEVAIHIVDLTSIEKLK
jgi:GNAT superfamily N-acetyltransferase